MKINLFFSSSDISPFELGGFEILGDKNSFLKKNYKSQDLQMIFISLVALSYAIRTKKNKYKMSSNITFTYKEKLKTFYINKVEIEKLSYMELLVCLQEVCDKSITILLEKNEKGAVVQDLRLEKKALENLLNKRNSKN